MSDAHVHREGEKKLKEKEKEEEEESQRPIRRDGRSRIYLAPYRDHCKPNKTIIAHSVGDRKGLRRTRCIARPTLVFFFFFRLTRRRARRLHARERDQPHVNLMIADEKRAPGPVRRGAARRAREE